MEKEKRNRTERMVLIALFSTLTWIGAYLRVDFIPPIPFTLQTLMVIMAGLILGPRDAPLSQGVYLLLGLSGVPVFTGGGGPGYILRPTFGFILGFVLAAAVVGRLSSLLTKPSFYKCLGIAVVGMGAIYLVAIPYLYLLNQLIFKTPVSLVQLTMGMVPFMLGDLAKSLVIAGVTPAILTRIRDL
ncbi:MAG: biotin transporter BioY [Firmicutes bacterium]|nr:biotin transporter BioY [Bacillota bacterium]